MGGIVSRNAFLPPNPAKFYRLDKNGNPSQVWIRTKKKDNMIPAFYFKYPNAKWTLIYSHGNAEDINQMSDLIGELSEELNVNIISYEYSGYGWSYSAKKGKPEDVMKNTFKQELTPSENSVQDDVESVYHHVVDELKINPKNIVIMGRSLGTGPSCHVSALKDIAGVILQSPFLSAIRVVLRTPGTLPFDIFPNIKNVPKIKAPICVIHGTQDEVINCSHGKELATKIKEPFKYKPLFIDGAGHNNIESQYADIFVNHIKKFLKYLETFQAPKSKPKHNNSISNNSMKKTNK